MSSNFPFLKNEGDWSLNSLLLEPITPIFSFAGLWLNAFGWVPFWPSPPGVSCNSQPHSFFSPQTTECISETFFWLHPFPSFWSEVEQIRYRSLESRFRDHTNKSLQELRHSRWVHQESEFDRKWDSGRWSHASGWWTASLSSDRDFSYLVLLLPVILLCLADIFSVNMWEIYSRYTTVPLQFFTSQVPSFHSSWFY